MRDDILESLEALFINAKKENDYAAATALAKTITQLREDKTAKKETTTDPYGDISADDFWLMNVDEHNDLRAAFATIGRTAAIIRARKAAGEQPRVKYFDDRTQRWVDGEKPSRVPVAPVEVLGESSIYDKQADETITTDPDPIETLRTQLALDELEHGRRNRR